ncbi:rCG63006 [Rattus norvegicus]|uniref:RCG63006 n=1 Tax=Rattus norvegicus TaxID=10116 RepID=A6ITV3_RAT|nr:rCG63006 [Rattus norvegicus]
MYFPWETISAFVSRSLHGNLDPMASTPSKALFGFLQLPECHEVFWLLLKL